jgi:hypothetical protein
MTKNWMRAALVVVLAVAAVAQARSLWVRVKDAPLLKDGKAGAKELEKEQPGTQVEWKAADPTKQFHQVVTAGKKEGWMHVSSITPKEPGKETATAGGQPMDPQKFASSGAATKALSEAGIKYAKLKDTEGNASTGIDRAARVAAAEGIALDVKPEKVCDFAVKSGLAQKGCFK